MLINSRIKLECRNAGDEKVGNMAFRIDDDDLTSDEMKEFSFRKYKVLEHEKVDSDNILKQKPNLDDILIYLNSTQNFNNESSKKPPYRYYNLASSNIEKTIDGKRIVLVVFEGGVNFNRSKYYNYETQEISDNMRNEKEVELKEQYFLFVDDEQELVCYRTYEQGVMHHEYYFKDYPNTLEFEIASNRNIREYLKNAQFKSVTEQIITDTDGNEGVQTQFEEYKVVKAKKWKSLNKDWAISLFVNHGSEKKISSTIIKNGRKQVFDLEHCQEKWTFNAKFNKDFGRILNKEELVEKCAEENNTEEE